MGGAGWYREDTGGNKAPLEAPPMPSLLRYCPVPVDIKMEPENIGRVRGHTLPVGPPPHPLTFRCCLAPADHHKMGLCGGRGRQRPIAPLEAPLPPRFPATIRPHQNRNYHDRGIIKRVNKE